MRLAVADAGLTLDDVDGLLINPGLSGGLDIGIAARLGLYNLPLLSVVNAVRIDRERDGDDGVARDRRRPGDHVVCVFADAPLTQRGRTGAAYGGGGGAGRQFRASGAWQPSALGARRSTYALAARRHMDEYGTTSDQLAAIAVAERAVGGR